MHYRGKKVALLGYGVEGQAAYDYWTKHDAKVTVHDTKADLDLPQGAKSVLGPNYLKNLDDYDLVVRSPGVFPYQFQTPAAVTSVTNEFLEHCPATVIGVTGSMGKGTTASLIHHILKTADETTYLGGNIGTSPLEFLDKLKFSDYVVLELSNLQLWDIKRSPQVAVLLMIVPEHMDWHRGNIAEYVATKANITKFQTKNNLLVYHGTNQYTTQIAKDSKAGKLPFYIDLPGPKPADLKAVWIDGDLIKVAQTPICKTSDVPMLGRHNLENVLAAIGATLGVVKDSSVTRQAIKSFKPLPHRLEVVGKVGDVTYVDDSIATHELATVAAIEAFNQPKVMILGGSDKGADFKQLAHEMTQQEIRSAILIGETTDKMEAALAEAGFDRALMVKGLTTMPEIIKAAAELSKPGDVVLLAPATASFGLFRDYKDRGDQFKAAVKRLRT